MSTDISLYVEVRGGDGWLAVPTPAELSDLADDGGECSECTPRGRSTCDVCRGTGRRIEWFVARNYQLFAILCSVRRDGVPIRGISDAPRGAPRDVSSAVRDCHLWEYAASWLSLAEVLAFDWDQTFRREGCLPLRDQDRYLPEPMRSQILTYQRWRTLPSSRLGPDDYYEEGISRGSRDLQILDVEEAARALCGVTGTPLLRDGVSYFVRLTFDRSYRQAARDFLAMIERHVVPLGSPDGVRLVFGFGG